MNQNNSPQQQVENLKIQAQELKQLLAEVEDQLQHKLEYPDNPMDVDQLASDLQQVEHHLRNSVNDCYES